MTLRKRLLIPSSSSLANMKGFVFPHPSIHDFFFFSKKKKEQKKREKRLLMENLQY
jgi:hypothetical protein